MRNSCTQVVLENFFEPCTLFLLLKGSSYGYDIQKQLKENCSCNVNIGNLYRCLSRLQKQGHVTRVGVKSEIGPIRYSYTITPAGKKYLKQWIKALKQQNKVISLLINNYNKTV